MKFESGSENINRMSKNISAIKIVAILSVVTAHVDVKVGAGLLIVALKYFYATFGSFGVGLFFILAGEGFLRQGFNFAERCQKIKNYGAPWIISATVIYIYLYLRKGALPFSYFEYVIGNGSYLYFLSILSIFLLGGPLLHIRFARILLLIISSIYMILGVKIMPHGVGEHLNMLLWIPYFIFGLIVAKREKVFNIVLSPEFSIIASTAVLNVFLQEIGAITPSRLNYQNPNLVFFVCCLYIFLNNITLMPSFDVVNMIGRNTLFIYLWHMPFIGIINHLANNFFIYIHFISPILVLIFFFLAICFIMNVGLSAKLANLIGIVKVH